MARIWVVLMIIPLSIVLLPSRFQAAACIDRDILAGFDLGGGSPDALERGFFAEAEQTSSVLQNPSFGQGSFMEGMIGSGSDQDTSHWSSYITMHYLGSINKTASIWILVSGLLGFLGIHQSRSRNGL